MIQKGMDALNSIVLRPKLTLSLSSFNRRTGTFSEQKSVSVCGGITLLHAAMLLAGGVGTFCVMAKLSRMQKEKKRCHGAKRYRRQGQK